MSNSSPPPTPPSGSVGENRFKCILGPYGESIEEYRPGGYHPVHHHDRFKNDRYEVIRKLGVGAFSTVWLAIDHMDADMKPEVNDKCVYVFCEILTINHSSAVRYVALKIEMAKLPKPSREVIILQHLLKAPEVDAAHVTRLLDLFDHEGPNGVHSCLVLEPMGTSVSEIAEHIPRPNPWWPAYYPMRMTKRILKDVLKGLTFLHENQVVHGDLNCANMLLTLKSAQIPNEEISQYINFQWGLISDPVERIEGKIDRWSPRHLTMTRPLTGYTNTSETCSVKLSDFGGGVYNFQLIYVKANSNIKSILRFGSS